MKRPGIYSGLLCLLAPLWAGAADLYPIVTVTCNTTESILKIKNEVKWDDEGKNFKYSVATGTYNPWDWVSIVSVAEGNARLVNKKAPLVLNCLLGKDNYKIVLEPKIFNRNYDGNCGKQLSVVATIFRGNVMVVDNKEFESYCHGNAPVVRGIKITGATGEVQVVTVPKFQFY